MRVVILLPWRPDNGWRDKLWSFCRRRWELEFPDWPIIQGTCDDGPFNRSQAINRAAYIADGPGSPDLSACWEVALIIDGDTVSDPAAIRRAVEYTYQTGELSIAHDKRVMMSERATRQALADRLPEPRWGQRGNFTVTYTDSVSCAVAVRRDTWDSVGGFDERFVGWGFEDTAFEVAVETLLGQPKHAEDSTCYHLWHPLSPEASKDSPTYRVNRDLRDRYLKARGDRDRLDCVVKGEPDPGPNRYGPIPLILWRTVPEQTSAQVEAWWDELRAMHPHWDARTVREPVAPAHFPLTGHLFARCANGAQKAGLIRLELLATYGGVYVDSDVQGVRPLDALTHSPAFAAWEDDRCVPDAILGAVRGHPAILECLQRAIALIEGGSQDAWETGPGVTTAVLPWRDDVLLLPPGSFYPVHYREKQHLGSRNGLPWVFAEHKWHHSWDPKKKPSPSRQAPVSEAPDDVVICIPWNDSKDQRRRDALDWCCEWWRLHGFKVVMGDGASRAEMCNDAARRAIAQGAEVLVFADADTWGPASQVLEAAELARTAGALVHAFDVYARLDPSAASGALRGSPARANAKMLARRGKRSTDHVSGLSAVSLELWGRIGGFDERFEKWGFEDQAFHLACETLGNEAPIRIEGPAIHWPHRADPASAQTPAPEALELITEYCQAAGRIPDGGRTGRLKRAGQIRIAEGNPDPGKMREVLAKEGGPLSRGFAVQ